MSGIQHPAKSLTDVRSRNGHSNLCTGKFFRSLMIIVRKNSPEQQREKKSMFTKKKMYGLFASI